MKKFEYFRIDTLFDIHPTKAYKLTNSQLYATTGNTPVLSNSSVNNGIGGYCGLDPTEPGNTITFSDTTTGADTIFYQPDSFIGYPHVQGLYPKKGTHTWCAREYLYLVALIKCAAGKGWNYSNKFTRKFVSNLNILLPITNSGEIDFNYMQERVKELEQERIKELDAYLKVTGLNDYELTEDDRELLRISGLGEYKGSDVKTYKNFALYKLFASSNGDVDLQKKDINGLGDWVVSSGVENRGFIGKSDAKAKTFNGNTITIDMFGNAFYRKDKYKMVTHARVFSLSPLFKELDELNAQFIVASLKSLKTIYSYSNMCSWNKIKNTTISLPIKTDDSKAPIIDSSRKYSADGYIPDWEFMSRYIKAIEKEVIADAVKKKDEIIEKTKEIVNKD